MIDKEENPLVWMLVGDDLSDAQEELTNLVRDFHEQPDFSEDDFRIQLAHVYAHLNRAWNRRDRTKAEEVADQQQESYWDRWTHFPNDIEPL